MNLQVQPLKVLATREVVTKRLDYSTYLNGTTKVELDRLDKLEGNFRIQSSKLTIDAFVYGKRLPSDDWEDWEKGHLKETMEGGLWTFEDDFIEDGKLVSVKTLPNDQWQDGIYSGLPRLHRY